MTQANIVLSAVDKTGQAFASAKRNMASLGDVAGSLPMRFGTLGTAIAAAFTAVTVKGAIDTLDKLDDLSEKTGIAVESLSALRYAGEVTGTPLEAIAAGVKKLSTSMADAAGGGKEAAASFKAVGVAVKNTDGTLRSQDAVLMDLADRFAGFEDGAAKSALAQKVFGKAGADMIPLLNQGSAGIRALRGEAEALGVVYGGDLAKQAASFNDNLKRLELGAEAAKVSLLSDLLPALNKIIDAFLRLKEAGQVWTVLKDAAKGVVGLNRLSDDPGADLQRLSQDRARIEKQRKFARGKGLPTRDLDSELFELEQLQETSRIRQAGRALDGLGTPSDAMSRRMRVGIKTAAPVVAGGDGKDKAADAAKKELEDRARLLAELSGVQGDYMEQLTRLQAIRAAGQVTDERYVELVKALIEKQPMAKKYIDETAQAEKDLADARQKAAEAAQQWLAAYIADNTALVESNKTLGEQIEMIGLTTEQVKQLTLARMQARIEAERGKLSTPELDEGERGAIEQRIRLMEEQRDKTGAKIDKDASAEFSDTLRGDVKGALQRAFEESENPGKAFIKAFASTLYTRVSSALADSLANAVLPGQQKAGGGLLQTIIGSAISSIAGGIKYSGTSTVPTAANYENSFDLMNGPKRSYDGGGYTGNASRSGGLDGKGGFMAMLHPQETVVDHARGQQGGGDLKLSIVNNTSAPIGRVTQRTMPDGERMLLLEEASDRAVAKMAAGFSDPNSLSSRSVQRNFNLKRNR